MIQQSILKRNKWLIPIVVFILFLACAMPISASVFHGLYSLATVGDYNGSGYYVVGNSDSIFTFGGMNAQTQEHQTSYIFLTIISVVIAGAGLFLAFKFGLASNIQSLFFAVVAIILLIVAVNVVGRINW